MTNVGSSIPADRGAGLAGGDRAGLIVTGLRSSLAGPFDLSVPPSSVISIAGASGSGKSLFLRMIADLDPNEGSVSLGGRSRADLDAPHWRRIAPYVAAESGWWREDVAGHFAVETVAAARALAQRLGVGAPEFHGTVGRLSTGERQRLALVRALVLDSPVLLLDEPTGPLDPASVARVEDVLAERARAGAIIIMASHDPLQGARLAATRYRMVARRLERQA